jgi:TetR/AcrR family transcriptional regulator
MARARRLSAKERKRQIIETARGVFAAQGYAHAGTADLAKAAGVSEPALYRYFPSKKDLFLATLRDTGSRLLEIWEHIAYEVEDPLETLWAIAVRYYDHLDSRAASMKLAFQALCEADDSEIREAARENFMRFADFVAGIVDEGKARSMIRPDVDSRLVAWQFVGSGLTLDLVHLLGLRVEVSREWVEEWGRLYLRSIRATPPKAPPEALINHLSREAVPLRQPPGPEVAQVLGAGWEAWESDH